MSETEQTPAIDGKATRNGLIAGLLFLFNDEVLGYFPKAWEIPIRVVLLLLVGWLIWRPLRQAIVASWQARTKDLGDLARLVPNLAVAFLLILTASAAVSTWEAYRFGQGRLIEQYPSVVAFNSCAIRVDHLKSESYELIKQIDRGTLSEAEVRAGKERIRKLADSIVSTEIPTVLASYLGEDERASYENEVNRIRKSQPEIDSISMVELAMVYVDGMTRKALDRELIDAKRLLEDETGRKPIDDGDQPSPESD